MRIAIDARMIKPPHYGIGRYAYSLIEHLLKIDRENEYFILVNNKNFLSPALKAPNLCLKLTASGPAFPFEHVEIPGVLKREEIDVFHTPSYVAPFVQPCAMVMTIHDVIPLIFPDDHSIMYQPYYEFSVKPAVQKAAKIITVSEHSKKDIVKFLNVSPEKIVVTYNASNGLYHPINDEESIQRVKSKYHIHGRFILYIGSSAPHKNISRLILAYHRALQMDRIRHNLVLATKKSNELSRMVGKLDLKKRVIFTGHVPEGDLPYLFNAADLFVFPSLYEGFGLPVLEAMACGTPVITSNTSSLPEVVGDAGILVDPYNVEQMGEAIFEVLKDESLRDQMKEKGFKRARSFSWNETAQKTLGVYQEIIR